MGAGGREAEAHAATAAAAKTAVAAAAAATVRACDGGLHALVPLYTLQSQDCAGMYERSSAGERERIASERHHGRGEGGHGVAHSQLCSCTDASPICPHAARRAGGYTALCVGHARGDWPWTRAIVSGSRQQAEKGPVNAERAATVARAAMAMAANSGTACNQQPHVTGSVQHTVHHVSLVT
jgi:hypothetical protein